jgi:hypothetical protein
MECPRCKLTNPESAQRCDCGYDFETKTVERPYFTSGPGIPGLSDPLAPAIKAIRYGLHFAFLTAAVVVFLLAQDLALGERSLGFDFFRFGIMGALHATGIVISLNDRRAIHPIIKFPINALVFITLATLWAAATPIMGLWGGSIVWHPIIALLPPSLNNLIFVLITGSAIGALGYWVLVRLFWIRSLRRMDLLKTVTLCVCATLLVEIYGYAAPSGLTLTRPKFWGHVFDWESFFDPLPTIAWWFAFSISLYWSETKITPRKRSIASGIAAVILVFAGASLLAMHQLDARVATDRARLSDLKSIAGALHVDWEYAQDKDLEWHAPAALKDIPKALQGIDGIRMADPVTGVAYDYLPLSGSKYQLCAVFDHDSTRQDPLLTDKDWSFAQGRQCFALDASMSP